MNKVNSAHLGNKIAQDSTPKRASIIKQIFSFCSPTKDKQRGIQQTNCKKKVISDPGQRPGQVINEHQREHIIHQMATGICHFSAGQFANYELKKPAANELLSDLERVVFNKNMGSVARKSLLNKIGLHISRELDRGIKYRALPQMMSTFMFKILVNTESRTINGEEIFQLTLEDAKKILDYLYSLKNGDKRP